MNNVNKTGISNYKDYELPPKEEGLINKTLPFIIFVEFLSYLNDRDIQSASLVSHLWNEASIDTTKRKKFSMIKGFTNFLCRNLLDKSYEAQKEKLLAIGSESTILNLVNLSQIRLSMYGSKESVLNILKDLKEEDLKSLEEVSRSEGTPKFFENVFDLEIYKELDEAKNIAKEEQKCIAIRKIVGILLNCGYVENALKAVNMIPDEYEKYLCLQEIMTHCIGSRNFEKALEAAIMIIIMPGYRFYFAIFQVMLHFCLKEGYFETAVKKIANMMPKEKYNLFLKDILIDFFKSGYSEQAIKVVDMMPNYRDILEDALKEFCGKDEKTALAVAKTISDKIYKSLALGYISMILLHKGNAEEALEVANMIPEENYKYLTLQDISKALLKKDDTTKKKGCIIQ